jgi:hypothetical protein
VFRVSYTGRAGCRQSPLMRIAAVVSLALSVAACARFGLPFNESGPGVDPMHTASLISAKIADRIDPSDWLAVRHTLGQIPARAAVGASIDWWNDRTNSTGTVSTLSVATRRDGSLCRGFATTINDLRGIRRYRGIACRSGDGWEVSNVAPDEDAVL